MGCFSVNHLEGHGVVTVSKDSCFVTSSFAKDCCFVSLVLIWRLHIANLSPNVDKSLMRFFNDLRPRVRNWVISIHLFKVCAQSATNGSDMARNIHE